MPSLSQHKNQSKVLFYDSLMNRCIKIGGISLICAVMGIFVFIFVQILPLFSGAQLKELASYPLPIQDVIHMGVDEWGERPFFITQNNQLYFADSQASQPQFIQEKLQSSATISRIGYDDDSQSLVVASHDGSFAIVNIDYRPHYQNDKRTIKHHLQTSSPFQFFEADDLQKYDFVALDLGVSPEDKLVGALIQVGDHLLVKVASLKQQYSLLGAGELEINEIFDVTSEIKGMPEQIRINSLADTVVVKDNLGDVYYFGFDGSSLQLKQIFRPFNTESTASIASMDFILGGGSLYLTHASGKNVIFTLSVSPNHPSRQFGLTKNFETLPGQMDSFAKSLQNKSFLMSSQNLVSLRYATTQDKRWEKRFEVPIYQVALTQKYHQAFLLDQQNHLKILELNDVHPEGGFKAFFSKIWYDGFSKPDYLWQSTGGSDAFEPKLSLIPLIIGTLKGTLYAMLFATPLALLAAFYTAEFLNPAFKSIIKPLMELMASLPSVILGFLGALWLAPLIENKVPSLFLMMTLVPLAAMVIGFVWSRLPIAMRSWLPIGSESLFLMPTLAIVAYLAWELGPIVESWICVVVDPDTGEWIADFSRWWPHVTGTSFEQRNSLVVGFMMGFAVIPIIFTITEDSLSMVPKNLRSAALACGASRWQTAWRVVLPTAAAGIFSALMVGLGRAVGETMIVLMATGNTPIMEWNIFSGMRTLSANLAVELPEAPFEGTLYRTLFLGALVLFIMTFVVNTFAELLRQYLRNRYKTV